MKNWRNVSRTRRCRHCGHDSWCSYQLAGGWELCRRTDTGLGLARIDERGIPFWLYKVEDGETVDVPDEDGPQQRRLRRLRTDLERAVELGESAWDETSARLMFKERRVDQSMCLRVPIRWDFENQAMVIPVESVAEEVEDSVLWRRPDEWPEKWIGPGIKQGCYMFGIRHLRSDLSGIIVLEGAFDVLSTGLLSHAVALLGSKLSTDQAEWIAQRFRTAVVWLDPDPAGRKGSLEIVKLLRLYGLKAKQYSTSKDPKAYSHFSPEVQGILRRVEESSCQTVS